ncbi:hypothetical protein Mal4_46190 [Maioricimonas rarisocia]|uniref:3-keto-alpha-glucoside-1,2-lyase/3-keto-2-hydroxy-glucal hydratase domain-containing protein n=1 Tax=Maioricimonas rarisocia TaxID=2528026 RepID=A0A517ZCP5_9PLAN|nr:DUF1080 domain-containing protein [Maioricimonas rarisocia]QDU40263.1 hypothetical protein Mal4_46190 [Maioricimonas rarisocia]
MSAADANRTDFRRWCFPAPAAALVMVFAVASLAPIGTSFGEETKSAAASDAKSNEKADSEKGWRPLFDGKSLENWKVTDFGGQGSVIVREKDKVLRIEQGEPLTGITWTGKDLPRVNYEIQLEAQRVDGNDFFCGLTFPVKKNCCSLILGGWGGGLTGISSINGFDASENETTDFVSFENGKWYSVRVVVTDTHIRAWVGDEMLADVDYSEKNIDVRLEMELCKPLGLATFQTVSDVRNFRIRELKPEAAKEGQ